MNKELKFLLKVTRNALILAGLMFFSTYATKSLTYETLKPIIVFFGMYIFTELANRYGLNKLFAELANRYGLSKSKIKTNLNTIIY